MRIITGYLPSLPLFASCVLIEKFIAMKIYEKCMKKTEQKYIKNQCKLQKIKKALHLQGFDFL
jgi:hypothetical protein